MSSHVLAALAFLAALPAHAHPGDDDEARGRAPASEPPPAPMPAGPAAPGADSPKNDWKVDAPHGTVHDVRVDTTTGTWMSVDVHHGVVLFDLLGDLWTVPLAGGDARRLTNGVSWDAQPRWSPDGTHIVFVSDRGGNENLWIMDADGTNARALTTEGDARVTSPVWDPSGQWIVARRRTVDTRSIGVTELWQWHVDGGKGFRLTSLDAHPHAGEVSFSPDGRWLYFSSRSGRFEYDHNPMGGLWSVWRMDRRTGESAPLVQGAGSASRPLVSRDGRTMLFVSRDRNRTTLEAIDLPTGKRRLVHPDLDRDEMEAFALHDTYPAMSWNPAASCDEAPASDCDEVVLWGKGKLWRMTLDGHITGIPFRAAGTWQVRETRRPARTVADTVTARVLRWPTTRADGVTAFSAMGGLWLHAPDAAAAKRLGSEGWTAAADGSQLRALTTTRSTQALATTGYAPAWTPDGTKLAWTSWSDRDGGRLHVTSFGKRVTDEVLPLEGQLVNPAWSADGASLVVLRGIGGGSSPDLANEAWNEIVQVVAPTRKGAAWTTSVVTSTPNRGSAARAPRLHLHEGRVTWMEDRATAPRKPGETALVSVKLDGTDKRTHLVLPGAEEVVVRPDFGAVAYKAGHDVHVTALPPWGGAEVRVEDGAFPVTTLTDAGGDWLAWSPDGKALTWAEGNELVRRDIRGIGTVRKPDGTVDANPDPRVGTTRSRIHLSLPRARPTGTRAIVHARALTMNGDEVIDDATIVLERDRIVSVIEHGTVPAGADVIDAAGRSVYPGLVDVHAHLHYAAGDVLPEQEWRYTTALDFGVTTVSDPSASTDTVFTQAERVEAGLMDGPRVYSTGGILYGALSNDGAHPTTPAEAERHVARQARVGATSVKVYQQSQRERRQWFVEACENLGVLCVPEGGGDLFQDLGMMIDGFHAIEHALPNAPLYDDVLQLWSGAVHAGARTYYTPTLLVAYGGLNGENWFYQHDNPVNDVRLLQHFPRRALDALAWRRGVLAMDEVWNFREVARSAARLQDVGVPVTLGAHGQLPGLGAHWELWGLASDGAMTPHEALRAATIEGARYLGLEGELGSIAPGKLADLVIVEGDPSKDIHDSVKIWKVLKNGQVH